MEKPEIITEEQIEMVATVLIEFEVAYTNFMVMSPLVKLTYTFMLGCEDERETL